MYCVPDTVLGAGDTAVNKYAKYPSGDNILVEGDSQKTLKYK